MSIKASWGLEDVRHDLVGQHMVVTEPDDVDRLLAQLGNPHATAANLVHTSRPLTIDEEGYFGQAGAQVVDHTVDVLVRDGLGYMTYFSPEHDYAFVTLVGNPNSPKAVSDQTEYDGGTGVPVETLAAALKEFLATAQRPTCVQWREA